MYTNKQIWSVSYPILLSLLAQNVINVTDTAFLGHVSEVALGASAMGGLFYICVFTIAFGFSTGSQIVIARRNGEGRYSDVGPVMIQGIMFLFVMALLLFGFTKAFGGNIMAQIVISESRPQFATVRYKVMDRAEKVEKPSGKVTICNVSEDMVRSRMKQPGFQTVGPPEKHARRPPVYLRLAQTVYLC